ncbi:MAG: cupin protein [Flavipsychrobacter sp.]|jgi:quercetin dioxygenase-like cupin family protein|nr:cupin protein [Flavipsychrobacter sp.]
MAVNIYESVVNAKTGETFRCIKVTPEAFTMQWTLEPKGYVPFEHIHYNQDEIFTVQKGELKVIIDGVPHIAGPGGRIVVPKGVRHIASNNKEEVMDAVVDYTPTLDHVPFFQCFFGMQHDGHIDKKNGGVKIPMIGYFMKKMKCQALARPTSIPAAAFNIALNVFYIMGVLKGWDKLYKKYTT